MPNLPIYRSQQNINANTAAPLRNEAAQPFQDQQKVLGAMVDVTQKWSDANDVMQYTEAKARYNVATTDIETRAAADPDYKNSDKYYKELEEAKKNSLSFIVNQQVAGKAALEFDMGNQLTAIKMNADFKAKQLIANKFNVGQSLEEIQKKKLSTDNPNLIAQFDQQAIDLLNSNVATGTLSLEEADKMLKASQKTGVQYAIYADNSTLERDSQVLKDLKDPKGKYSYLDSDERLKLIEESQKRIFQNNQTLKKDVKDTQEVKYDSLIKDLAAGQVDLSRIDQEMLIPPEQGGIPVKQLLDLREGIIKNNKSSLEVITGNDDKAKEYSDTFTKVLDDKVTLDKAREILYKAYKDEYVDPQEIKVLETIKRYGNDITKNKEHSIFKAAADGLVKFFTGREAPDNVEISTALKEFVSRVGAGEDPTKVSTEIKNKNRLKTKPDVANFPENGQLMIDPVSGVKALVFPDGRIEAVK